MGKATEPRTKSSKGRSKGATSALIVVAGSTEMEAIASHARRQAQLAQSDEPLVNEFAAAHGDYREVEFQEAAGRRKEKHLRNVGGSIVDRWMLAGGTGFDEPQRRAVDYVRTLWRNAGTETSMVANLDRVRSAGSGSGFTQQEALSELAEFKRRVPADYWATFENVVRWDEPAGTAGSRFANNAAQSIASARTIVGMVASLIALWCRF